MFERLQKPFLTVETGEAYQPIRLAYEFSQKDKLVKALNELKCCQKNSNGETWNWYWRDECDDLHFESLETFKRNPSHPLRIGTLTIREDKLYINLPSFKRACMAVPFFHKIVGKFATILKADFINKVYGIDERLPHGFSELFKEDELEKLLEQRLHDYEEVKKKAENAESAEEALSIVAQYTTQETQKRLPYAERYSFHYETSHDESDVMFLGFYIFLRGRELVAIRRWFGETGYTLSNVAEDTMQNVFGQMDIDIIE